ncbi:MAG: GNAT family N-acetyltransferase [Desulfovibrionaceae bacterium]
MPGPTIRIATDCTGVDWEEACRVFERAPLGTREPEKLRLAFERSALVRFAKDGERLVGMARAISDGVYQAVIYDVCILPEYQGKGLGSRLVASLMEALPGLTVLLYAVPGREGFYGRHGFERMATAMARFSDPERMGSQGYLRSGEP